MQLTVVRNRINVPITIVLDFEGSISMKSKQSIIFSRWDASVNLQLAYILWKLQRFASIIIRY